MLILFVTNNYKPYAGGVVSSIDTAAAALRARGHTVYIVTFAFTQEVEQDPFVLRIPCSIRFMYKKNTIKLFLLALMLISTLSFAADKIDLSEHGKDLMKAPFTIRYAFYKEYHKDWVHSIYSERNTFLTKWHKKQIADAKAAAIKARQDAIDEKNRQREKNEKIRDDKLKLRAKEQEEKDYERDFKNQGRNFDQKVRDEQRELLQLQRQRSNQ